MQETILVSLEAAPFRGGVAAYLQHSLMAARDMGINVALAAPKDSLNIEHSLPCNRSQSPINIFFAANALKELTANCIYLAEAAAIKAALSPWAWDWTKKQRIRLILHGSEILEMADSGKFRELLLRAEKIYTLSRAVAQLAIDVEPSLIGKVIITGAAPSPSLTVLPIPREEKRLLTVGRLHPRKGQQTILDALSANELPGFRYEIVGKQNSSIYAKNLEKFTKKHSLPVCFHGEADDARVSLLYAQCSLFVLPAQTTGNRIEGYGLALLDAAAMGLPVVATDCGGISEAVQHCRTGLLVPPIINNDRKALVEAILQLSSDERMWNEMSRAAQTWAEGKSWKNVAEKLFA